MTLYNPSVAGLFAKKVQAFQHPAVDSSKTELVPYSIGSNGTMISIGVNLYGHEGELLIEDREIGEDDLMPGMLFTVDLNGELRIDNAYIKGEHAGLGVGTQFICDLMETARSFGFDGVQLIADESTGAERYWTKKHGFVSVDGSLRLEKRF
jgi:hypothetical protein